MDGKLIAQAARVDTSESIPSSSSFPSSSFSSSFPSSSFSSLEEENV
jgi:hypothetical protein